MTVFNGGFHKASFATETGKGTTPAMAMWLEKKKMWQFEIEIAWQNTAGQVTGFGRMKMQQIYPVDEVK